MSIPEGYRDNFDTLKRASNLGHLALLETQDRATGKTVYAVCAVNFDGAEYSFAPVAKMFDGHPYEELNPPDPAGGFIKSGEG